MSAANGKIAKTLAAVGAPSPSPGGGNLAAVGLKAERIARWILEYGDMGGEKDEDVDVDETGVSWNNRGGGPPNENVLHKRITGSFAKEGYDPGRHLPPIYIRCRSDGTITKLLTHNNAFSKGRASFPRIFEKRMRLASLAGSHLSIAFRCCKPVSYTHLTLPTICSV